MRTLITAAGIVAAAGLVITVDQASEAQEAQFAGETTVNTIEVPVQVLDPDTGLPVTGLTAKDFRIFESGRKQKITHFAEIARVPERGSAEATTLAGRSEPRAKPLGMVYLLDLYLMRTDCRDHAIEALRHRYRAGIPGGEEVSIVVFDGALRVFIDRSNDRSEVLGALDALGQVRAHGIDHELSLGQDLANGPVTGTRDRHFYERRQRSQEFVYELERRVRRVGAAISATMARYARADARKVLVFFSPGQPRTRWAPSYAPVDFVNAEVEYPTRGLWQKLSNEAADLGFTLFAIDSSGIDAFSEGDAESARLGSDSSASTSTDPTDPRSIQGLVSSTDDGYSFGADTQAENIGPWMERVRKDLLITAAEDTGGRAFFAAATSAVDQVAASLDHYYSLAYVTNHGGDGQTYSIEVTLPRHKTYLVHHRRAYVDQLALQRAAQRLRSTMLFGGDANPLGIRVDLGEPEKRLRLGAAGSKRVRIPIQVKIPIGRLEMVPRGDVHWGKVAVTFFSEDAAGNQSELTSFEQPITIPTDQIHQARAKGYFSYVLTVEVEGGEQHVYIGVEDLIGGGISIVPEHLHF